jgi:hypothetical protein
MIPTRRLLVLALASALPFVAAPAFAQQPPPQPAPQAKDAANTDAPPVQLEQDALDTPGIDPAKAPAQTAKGKAKPGDKDKDAPKWDVTAAHG